MGHLSSRILVTSRVHRKFFDANLRVERALVCITGSPLPNILFRKRKGPRYVVGGREDSSSTTYPL